MLYDENQGPYFRELHLLVLSTLKPYQLYGGERILLICDEVASSVKNCMMKHRRQIVTEGWHSFAGKDVPRMEEQNHEDYNWEP